MIKQRVYACAWKRWDAISFNVVADEKFSFSLPQPSESIPNADTSLADLAEAAVYT